jgi:hypothetical protein
VSASLPWLAWGGGLIVAGLILWWRAGRYDLKGKALDSAIDVVRGKRNAGAPTSLEREWADIASQRGLRRKATRAAGKVAAHAIWQVLGIAGLVGMLIGAGLAAYGLIFK